MANLLSVRAGDQVASGLFVATNPLDAPLWVDGRNILFRDGGVEKAPGFVSLLTVAGAGMIRGMEAMTDTALIQRLFLGDQTKLYQWAAGTLSTVGIGFTGSADEGGSAPASCWRFAPYGDWMLATNGVDPVQVWKKNVGTFAALDVDGQFATAEVLVRRGPHILAFGSSGGSAGAAGTYHWCSADDPENWDPDATDSAGFQPIAELQGPIVAAVPLGDMIAVLGRNQLFLIRYTGAPFYFPYQPALTGVGAVGKRAVVEANRRLYGMSLAGFWTADGTQYSYIDTPALRDYLLPRLNTAQLSKAVCWYDQTNQLVLWSVPTVVAEPDVTVGYHVASGTWTIFDWARTAAVPQVGVFRQPYTACADGKVYAHNSGVDAGAGVGMAAYVQSKPLDCGDAGVWKAVNEVRARLRRLAGAVNLQIGTQRNSDDPVTWLPAKVLDDGNESLWLRASGRYLTLRIESMAIGADWALTGFDLLGAPAGERR